MTTLAEVTGKEHLSYSALDSLLTCGERFRLERVLNVPQTPAWWFIGGSAFHTATEWWDKGEDTNLSSLWTRAWEEECERSIPEGYDRSKVRAGGRATKANPDKENEAWWMTNGPLMLAAYATWRADSGYTLIESGVEVPFDIELGGVPVHGYVDRVFATPSGEPIVVDIKTGSRAPSATLQLGVYSLGIEKVLGFRPLLGAYYMSRKAELTQERSLRHYNPDTLGKWYSRAKRIIEGQLFIPHVTPLCDTCSVATHCVAVGGIAPEDIPF